MEGASGGWSDMNHTTGPAFDVGMAFSEAELDFILFEGASALASLYDQRSPAIALSLRRQSCWTPPNSM